MAYFTFLFTARRQFTRNLKYQYNQVIKKKISFLFPHWKKKPNGKSGFSKYIKHGSNIKLDPLCYFKYHFKNHHTEKNKSLLQKGWSRFFFFCWFFFSLPLFLLSWHSIPKLQTTRPGWQIGIKPWHGHLHHTNSVWSRLTVMALKRFPWQRADTAAFCIRRREDSTRGLFLQKEHHQSVAGCR